MSGPERGAQPVADVATDALPQHLDVGILAEQRVGHRACELGLVGDQHRDVPQHLDDARGRIRRDSCDAGGDAASLRQNTSATKCSLEEK